MVGRRSNSNVLEREVTKAGSRAADAVSGAATDLAGRAMTAARGAQRAASPVLRGAAERSADTLSHAAERAAEVLADTAEKLAESGEDHATQATILARTKLADASESLAKAVRPRKRRRLRKLVAGALVAGGIVALVRSPLKSKIADKLFGAPPDFDDDEPESITLPSSPQQSSSTEPTSSADDESAAPNPNGASNGIPSASPAAAEHGSEA